jgi:hypothetical protein
MGFGWSQVSQAFAGFISRHYLGSSIRHIGFFAALMSPSSVAAS